jgi:hypothetical protein
VPEAGPGKRSFQVLKNNAGRHRRPALFFLQQQLG